MDATEAKLKCVELAMGLQMRVNDYSVDGVVKTASALYDFVNAPAQGDSPELSADKPKRGRKAATPDILS